MIAYDVATKVLDTESFPQYNIAGLITFIVLFSQEKPLRWNEINTHTNTHTHTYTHTHTHAYIYIYTDIHTNRTFYMLVFIAIFAYVSQPLCSKRLFC